MCFMQEDDIFGPAWINDLRYNPDRKRIVCFGDSFIRSNNAIVNGTHFYNHGTSPERMGYLQSSHEEISSEFTKMHNGGVEAFDEDHPSFKERTANWMTMLAMDLDYDFMSFGMSGTGTFYSYYAMLNYLQRVTSPPDVIFFVLNTTQRLFNRKLVKICPGRIQAVREAQENDTWKGSQEASDIIDSAERYFADLYDPEYEMDRLVQFCYYFDNHIVPQYPDTKFVILNAFGESLKLLNVEDWADPDTFEYVYEFKNCCEIRPPLYHFSHIDEMPEDAEFDPRANHFSYKVHREFSGYMVVNVNDYKPGPSFVNPDLTKEW